MRSLNKLLWLQRMLIRAKWIYYTRFWGMDIHPTARFSQSVRFDKTYPRGVHIGEESYVAFDVAILARSIVLPGVEIGDECVIGSGSVVTKNVPPRSIAAGNPAVVIRSDIEVGPYGRFASADRKQAELVAQGAFT